MHLALRFHIETQLSDARFFGRKRGAKFVQRPGEIIAVVIERVVRVLACVEAAIFLDPRVRLIHPRDNAFGDLTEERIAGNLPTMNVILEQLRIVVGHLLEVRHEPAFVHGVTMKAAGELIVHAAARHSE